MAKILIVEDEKNIRESIHAFLSEKYEVESVENANKALNLFKNNYFDLMITDMKLPDINGIELIKKFKEILPDSSIIVITAFISIQNAIDAMKAGANEYIPKPFSLDELALKVENLLNMQKLTYEKNFYIQEREKIFGEIIGESYAIKKVKDDIKKVAGKNVTILITGETGTGKELVAYTVYKLSGKKGPFIPVHCAAYAKGIIESELFGHEKGSFTGAEKQRIGKIELAENGILFLDELGDIPLDIQVKLLRVIENRTFERVGSNVILHTNAQIICATNKNLEQMVKNGLFREDLYYRINVYPIHIPPLRERIEDIPLLAHYFSCKKGNYIIDKKNIEILQSYSWPGNVRELQNIIDRAIILSTDNNLRIDLAMGSVMSSSVRTDFNFQNLSIDNGFDNLVAAFEKSIILNALKQNNYNQTLTAKKLKIKRSTLQYKIKKYKIDLKCSNLLNTEF